MHLNDSFGAEPGFSVRYMHHEQACSMAAEGYARMARKPAVLNVTSGPGSINALNGVFGAYTDSIPMIVVAGQVRRDTMTSLVPVPGLRQLGDQEARLIDMVSPITVWAESVTDPQELPQKIDRAVIAAVSGRPGPAWLEIPVDVQGADIESADPDAPLPLLPSSAPAVDLSIYSDILSRIATSRRPLILAGTGIRAAGVEHLLVPLAEALGVPVATAWTHDTFPSDHPLYAGRPGTIGTRAGNFIAQSADLIVVLGSRLNIRQVSYNWAEFAPHATIVWIDIDEAELRKPYLEPHVPIVADLRELLPGLLDAALAQPSDRGEDWAQWCRDTRARFEPHDEDYAVREGGINPYHLVSALGESLTGEHAVVCGDATACIVPFQVLPVRPGMRLFSNSGCASMGYDLPAALGAAVASPSQRIVCLAGDGSIMMNLQELQTLAAWRPNVTLIVLDNGGYLSILQTQRNFFGREFGASEASGVTFPDFGAVAEAFGLDVTRLLPDADWRRALANALSQEGPHVCIAKLDQSQEFEPRLRSRMREGRITTPPLDDMYPHLDDDVLLAVRTSALETI
jgi:acetolactate synthase-1/2/3 large subunit